jgi:hypothetical protein
MEQGGTPSTAKLARNFSILKINDSCSSVTCAPLLRGRYKVPSMNMLRNCNRKFAITQGKTGRMNGRTASFQGDASALKEKMKAWCSGASNPSAT